jgi:hypothetical protein
MKNLQACFLSSVKPVASDHQFEIRLSVLLMSNKINVNGSIVRVNACEPWRAHERVNARKPGRGRERVIARKLWRELERVNARKPWPARQNARNLEKKMAEATPRPPLLLETLFQNASYINQSDFL